jgi:hypothetical protein
MTNPLYFDFILLIFNCKRYEFKALKQKETWLKDFILMPYFHVQGDPDLETEYHIDYNTNKLYVKVADDYNSLPKKVIAAYNAINKLFVFKYIFKTDDDQNLSDIKFFTSIQKILLSKEPKIHYAGHIIDVQMPYLSQYNKIHPELPSELPVYPTKYCSGRFYLLSDLAIQQVISKKKLVENEFLEDYAIGYYLDPFLKSNVLNIQTNKYFTDIDFT